MNPAPPKSTKPPNTIPSLLRRAHSPTTATNIYTDKFQNKTLSLLPTTNTTDNPLLPDARARRRKIRNDRLIAQGHRRRKKPQPLSAAEKRKLCIYDIPKEERKYTLYAGLHELWCGYMREILLGWGQDASAEEKARRRLKPVRAEPQQAGAKLASADFHGAEVEAVRSRCVGTVGVKGIVVRDTMFTFEVVTRRGEVKVLPKEHSVFRFEVPVDEGEAEEDKDTAMESDEVGEETKGTADVARGKSLVFEIHGDQFKVRAPDRATKKFRLHISPDL